MSSQVQVTPTRISVPASATEQRLVTSFGDTVYYGTSSVTSSSYTGTLTDGQQLKISDVTWFVTAADVGRKVPGGARLSVIEHDVDAAGPTTVLAHVPTDADFSYTPPDGAQALDSSTGIEYVRIAGTWTAVSAGSSGVVLPWATGTAYLTGQPVTNGGKTWLAVDNHTAGATFSGDSAHWTLLPVASSGLTPTAVKTANYTAAPGDLVRVDTTSGAVTVTLPAAAAGGSPIGVKLTTLGAGNAVTIAAAGSDVFNKAGGGSTLPLTLLNQGVVLAPLAGVWVVQSDDLALTQLDARYRNASVIGYFDVTAAPYNADKTGTTDCTAAIQAAIDAAAAVGGGTVYFPRGTYLVNGAQQTGGTGIFAYSGQLVLPAVSFASAPIMIRLKGEGPPPMYILGAGNADEPVEAGGSILKSNATSGWVIDSNSLSQLGGFAWTNLDFWFEDLVLRVPNDPACGGMNLTRVANAHIYRSTVGVNAANQHMSTPTHQTYAIALPSDGNLVGADIRDSQTYGWWCGVQHSECALLDNFGAYNCTWGIEVAYGHHLAEYNHVVVSNSKNTLRAAPGAGVYPILHGTLILEDSSGAGKQLDIYDPNSMLVGELAYAKWGGGARIDTLWTQGAASLKLRCIPALYTHSLAPTATLDTFNRADNNYSIGQFDTGQVWETFGVGVWGLSGSKAKLISGGGAQGALVGKLHPTVDPTNHTIQADITVGSSSMAEAGLCFRRVDNSNRLYVHLAAQGAANWVKLKKLSGGTETVLATSSGLTLVNGTTYTVKVIVTTTTITVYVNGTQYISYTLTGGEQTAYNAATRCGLHCFADTSSQYDNFSVV